MGFSFVLAMAVGALARAQDAKEPAAEETAEVDRLRAIAFAPARTRARRVKLMEMLGDGAVVIVKQKPTGGAEELDEWQASKDLLYLTGLREPEIVLVLTKSEHVVFFPPRDIAAEKWRGARLYARDGLAEKLGVDRAASLESLKSELASRLEDARAVYLSGMTKAQLKELAHVPESVKLERGDAKIGLLRQVKDEAELALLRRACDASCAGHVEAIRSVAPGRFEFELQAVAEYVWHRYGAERQGYASIVGSGPNSCILHYSANRRRIADGDIICADMAGEVCGYTADVTRTFPASGRFTERQRAIYDVVLRAQETAMREVHPGSNIRRVHAAAKAVIDEAGYGKYFPHGTSHWLGLDVHDAGDYTRPFEPGMVLTVEPGIYIPSESIGVRIEDDVLVTNDGFLILSDGVPRTAEAMEQLVRDGHGVGAGPVAPIGPLRPLPPLRRGRLY